jgi:hypothetical protein
MVTPGINIGPEESRRDTLCGEEGLGTTVIMAFNCPPPGNEDGWIESEGKYESMIGRKQAI